jgi:DNA-binding transcriptional regulator LsrR (DeoR family)
VVVDVPGYGDEVIPALGAATAGYLETTLMEGGRLGVSSWSATLPAAAEAMRSRRGERSLAEVVRLTGGVGDPQVQVQATRLMGRLAEATGAERRPGAARASVHRGRPRPGDLLILSARCPQARRAVSPRQ